MNRHLMEVLEKTLREYHKKPIILDDGEDVKFDMNTWHCGPAACAAGIACMLPEFQEEGLRVDTSDVINFPVFGKFKDYEAMQHVLDITYEQSEWLFDPNKYIGFIKIRPIHVADGIRALLDLDESDKLSIDKEPRS